MIYNNVQKANMALLSKQRTEADIKPRPLVIGFSRLISTHIPQVSSTCIVQHLRPGRPYHVATAAKSSIVRIASSATFSHILESDRTSVATVARALRSPITIHYMRDTANCATLDPVRRTCATLDPARRCILFRNRTW